MIKIYYSYRATKEFLR